MKILGGEGTENQQACNVKLVKGRKLRQGNIINAQLENMLKVFSRKHAFYRF